MAFVESFQVVFDEFLRLQNWILNQGTIRNALIKRCLFYISLAKRALGGLILLIFLQIIGTQITFDEFELCVVGVVKKLDRPAFGFPFLDLVLGVLEGEARPSTVIGVTTIVLCDLTSVEIAEQDKHIHVEHLRELDGLFYQIPLPFSFQIESFDLGVASRQVMRWRVG